MYMGQSECDNYFKLFAHPLSELESIPEESCRLYTVHTDACRVPRRGCFNVRRSYRFGNPFEEWSQKTNLKNWAQNITWWGFINLIK
jgi:hypothetical protein